MMGFGIGLSLLSFIFSGWSIVNLNWFSAIMSLIAAIFFNRSAVSILNYGRKLIKQEEDFYGDE